MKSTDLSKLRIATANFGKVDPESFQDYISAGGMSGLEKAEKMEPREVYLQVMDSGLQGRGGAGFPTGAKEKDTGEALCDFCGPKYVVCNADEGEPGTFKDRVLMEEDPHLVLEGMLISAYAIGATGAYIYIRGEYNKAINRIRKALTNLREAGYLGEKKPGGFDIELRIGAGSYLCGEELTLLESLEGRRGYPRIKPPYPSRVGLFGAPTLINNVETFAHVPWVIREGADAYRRTGYEGSPGTKIFTVSGDVKKPGWYEEELGITLRELIFDRCEGIKDGDTFLAAITGGAAGTFVDNSMLDTPLAFNTLKAAGASLGSGAVIVIGRKRKLLPLLSSILEFFCHESCGKCIPCRIGTNLLVSMAEEAMEVPEREIQKKKDLLIKMVEEADFMDKTSLCPLGKSPILPLKSLARYFSEEL
jgi:NADH:ubiquinone oxidoreductase subunit F (NADH-binding)